MIDHRRYPRMASGKQHVTCTEKRSGIGVNRNHYTVAINARVDGAQGV
jgi:hypothetical protein